MGVLRISKRSARIPLLLLLSEAAIFIAAVLIAAFLGFSDSELQVGSGWLLLQALVFAAIMMACMLLMGLYRGRPNEGVLMGFARLGASFIIGVVALNGLFVLAPDLRIGMSSLVLATVLAFFFLGTIRPVFFDTILAHRGRRRSDLPGEAEQVQPTGETGGPPPADQSLTGQHRISGRWL